MTAKGYSSKGAVTGRSANSKQVAVKLDGSSLRIDDTGFYRQVQKDDPEYKLGITKVFVNGSYKVGTDVPSGWYLLYPTNKNQAYDALVGEKPGIADSIIKAHNSAGSIPGDTLMIFAEEGTYLTLSNCYAVKI